MNEEKTRKREEDKIILTNEREMDEGIQERNLQ